VSPGVASAGPPLTIAQRIYDRYCAFAQLTLGFHSPNMPLGFGRHPQMCNAHTLSGGPSAVNGWPSSVGAVADNESGTM
jgi:hypothetical protein